ncbi:MAG: hypothetical protein KCHDKBKB_02395 [Elusimicrobia bacterium]|nr:hypothetical protein [Elusimicrobiota bacterium]
MVHDVDPTVQSPIGESFERPDAEEGQVVIEVVSERA